MSAESESAIRHIKRLALPVRLVTRAPDDPLRERAARLWPDSPALQAKWINAVAMVRSTRRGWLLERPIKRGS